VDASFAVHPDFKSHTGGMMTLGKGTMQSIGRKQKLIVQSSTEGELVAVDNAATMILWTKLFLEAQGYVEGADVTQSTPSTWCQFAFNFSMADLAQFVLLPENLYGMADITTPIQELSGVFTRHSKRCEDLLKTIFNLLANHPSLEMQYLAEDVVDPD
jgi:hypothetical protein